MGRFEALGRRSFITQLGRGVLGIAVLGTVAACADGDGGTSSTTAAGTTTGAATPSSTSTRPTTTVRSPVSTSEAPTTTAAPIAGGVAVERVNLGFVSAYILVRGSEAAIVDTGVSGSGASIEQGLSEVGLGWADVGHVILTHLHGDHIGSLGEVMAAASGAVGYAGGADMSGISSPRELIAVGAGDSVFGTDIVPTPGHTPGHISVFDPVSRVLISGDAINGAGSGMSAADVSGVAGPNPQFTPDMSTAGASVELLAALQPDAIFFGHGEPLLQGAAAALDALARG